MNITKQHRERPKWLHEMDFMGMHLIPLLAFFTHVTAFDWILCAALYVVRMFFVTGGYHRYFSHRAFKTSRFFQFILAGGAQSSFQKGVLWWAANHRVHHKHSDTPEDPHSANLYGFWYAHIGWIMGPEYKPTRYELIKDMKHKELYWLNKYHFVPPVVLALAVYLVGNKVNGTGFFDWGAGVSTLLIGFFLSTIILFHGTFTINSLMHKIGKQRYKTGDQSRNSLVLALVTLGEGWHNNHHYYQSAAQQGFYWWEIDITYYIIRALGALGIVWDIRGVPVKVKESNKLNQPAGNKVPIPAPEYQSEN
ncbi:Delta-9 acyl-phospholipid desaturase [Chitinophaga rupis]|jgi:stearoyl-CoA desaturase (delta-9 desaturase)|uniref:Delta-9 acyl-phospholipid desaturase n=1 Tax=Chitinophaga rupis TaxID=573321 RepID=A0A1H7KHN8_9BACT|nr:acyl-CoA desaturase [Chitinophaga rupis]SEK86292.1 Delta-9 acyl-phospholipid desaturase [Chitinophaga rupis]